jgi:hypothetical protein
MLLKTKDYEVVVDYFTRLNFDLENDICAEEFAKLIAFRFFNNEPNAEKFNDDIDIIFRNFEENNSIMDIVETLSEWSEFNYQFEEQSNFVNPRTYDRDLERFVFEYVVDYIKNINYVL